MKVFISYKTEVSKPKSSHSCSSFRFEDLRSQNVLLLTSSLLCELVRYLRERSKSV